MVGGAVTTHLISLLALQVVPAPGHLQLRRGAAPALRGAVCAARLLRVCVASFSPCKARKQLQVQLRFTRGYGLAKMMAGSSSLRARSAVPTRFAFPEQGEQSALKVRKKLLPFCASL